MRKKLIATLSLAIFAASMGVCTPAEAGPYKINKRQKYQKHRIKHGIRNGSLNKKEAKRLRRQQKKLNQREARLRKDGLTKKERHSLRRQQDKLSKNIYKQKNDRQNRGPRGKRNQLFDVNKTQARHNQRIRQGVKSGELTNKEAAKLRKQQNKFKAREAKLRQDGLTLKERRKLDKHQDKLSKQIYKQKNDKQKN